MQKIIKDKKIVNDLWSFTPDDRPLTEEYSTVSLARWQREKNELLNHKGPLGIRIKPDEKLESLGEDLEFFKLIELDFPAFNDGRCFSQARLLRERFRYDGEIRATGRFMRDQLYYLWRVGVDSFKLETDQNLEEAAKSLNDFSVNYQKAVR
ncbi:MAG: DUF934 domain-containing protein [Gammaproteobacteria bacterium]